MFRCDIHVTMFEIQNFEPMFDNVIFLIHLTLLLLFAFQVYYIGMVYIRQRTQFSLAEQTPRLLHTCKCKQRRSNNQNIEIQNDQLAQKESLKDDFIFNFYFIYMYISQSTSFYYRSRTQYWKVIQQNCAIQKTVYLLCRSDISYIIGRGQTHRQRIAWSEEKFTGYVMYMYIIVLIYHFILQYAALHTNNQQSCYPVKRIIKMLFSWKSSKPPTQFNKKAIKIIHRAGS